MSTFTDHKTSGGVAYVRAWLGAAGDDGAPLLLFAHGTGFHAAVFEPLIDELSELPQLAALGPLEAIAFDCTGHGLSRPLPGEGAAPERCNWAEVGPRDVFELLQEVAGARTVYGVGHSFGGASLVLSELARPGTFRSLILLEPVLRPEPKTGKHPLAEVAVRRKARMEVGPLHTPTMSRRACRMRGGAVRVAHRHRALTSDSNARLANRTAQVGSHEELVAYYAKRLTGWEARAVDSYCRRGFSPLPEGGGYSLNCAPEVEASVYLGGMASSVVVHRLGELACHVAIAAGQTSMTLNAPNRNNLQAFEEIAAACPQLILPLAVAPCGHNLMAELPAWTATFVCGALKDCLRADSRL